jgi:hypothetical protein
MNTRIMKVMIILPLQFISMAAFAQWKSAGDNLKSNWTTDVETECNGMITYDREIMKVDKDRVREINLRISNSLSKE